MSKLPLFVAGFLVIIVSGCSTHARDTGEDAFINGPTAATPIGAGSGGLVDIERLRVFIKERRPQAFVEGPLGDGCTSLKAITQTRIRNEINIRLTSVRVGDVCTMMLEYLRRWVPLDGAFAPGSYTIRANQRSLRFQLVANQNGDLVVSPDPGPLPDADDAPPVPSPPDPR
jgi:hypothetical protein